VNGEGKSTVEILDSNFMSVTNISNRLPPIERQSTKKEKANKAKLEFEKVAVKGKLSREEVRNN
jgi:hypothetical protein